MSEYAPHPVFVAGELLGRGLFDAQGERFEGATFLELLDADGPGWLAEQLAETPGPRAVIAHGLAGAPALALARSHPDLLQGIVLIGVAEQTQPLAEGDDLVEATVSHAFVDSGSPEAGRIREGLRSLGPDAIGRALEEWRLLEVGADLEGTEVPTLIVAGGRDRLAPLGSAEVLARRRPDAGLAVLPSAGHASPTEAPGAVDMLAAAFLARLELTLAEGEW